MSPLRVCACVCVRPCVRARPHMCQICGPSRASTLTGRYPFNVGFYGDGAAQHITNYTTYPELLRRAGYATHAIGKWDVGYVVEATTATAKGFDTFLGYYKARAVRAEPHTGNCALAASCGEPARNNRPRSHCHIAPQACNDDLFYHTTTCNDKITTDLSRNDAATQTIGGARGLNGTYSTRAFSAEACSSVARASESTMSCSHVFMYVRARARARVCVRTEAWVSGMACFCVCACESAYESVLLSRGTQRPRQKAETKLTRRTSLFMPQPYTHQARAIIDAHHFLSSEAEQSWDTRNEGGAPLYMYIAPQNVHLACGSKASKLVQGIQVRPLRHVRPCASCKAGLGQVRAYRIRSE